MRKAVQVSKSLSGAETRGSPLLTVFPRVLPHTLCNCTVWSISALPISMAAILLESAELSYRPMQSVDSSTVGMLQSGINAALGNVTRDEWRWNGNDRNSTSTIMELLNKHGAVSCNFTVFPFYALIEFLNRFRKVQVSWK